MTTLLPAARTADPDAINRLDDDTALPGDAKRADVFDAQCRQSYDVFQARLDRMQRLAWLDAHVEVCDGCEHCEATS